MKIHLSLGEQVKLIKYFLQWLLRIAPVAIIIGSACALFLWSLDTVTTIRLQNDWLLFLLPLAGVLVAFVYQKLGRSVQGGNNLIVEEIHEPSAGVPIRMAPLVYIGTIITHLFGGSAGREGTAVQIGGSISSFAAQKLGLTKSSHRIMMMAGMAAGFGAVFGTPLAGAVFALEVLAIGKMEYDALIPCLMASVIGDLTCRVWGIHHEAFSIISSTTQLASGAYFQAEWTLLLKVVIASILFAMASVLFSELSHKLISLFKKFVKQPLLRPVVGAVAIIILTYLLGTRDYLGLTATSPTEHSISIVSAFREGGVGYMSWFWKLLFTAITLSSGFIGGEVTPLFFIGAALGNVLALLLGAPVDLFAALGFVAVFAGATNTPLASLILSVELFGSGNLVYFAVACFLSYLFSGNSTIYQSQRLAFSKDGTTKQQKVTSKT